jgi:hypothetical protein
MGTAKAKPCWLPGASAISLGAKERLKTEAPSEALPWREYGPA